MTTRRGGAALVLLPESTSGASLRADVESVLATYEAGQRAHQERVAAVVARLAAGTPGLREAHVSPDASEVIFVGDDWDQVSDRVSELLDAIGADLDPSGATFIWGGLRLDEVRLPTYLRVPLT